MIIQGSRKVLTKELAQASVPGMNWILNNTFQPTKGCLEKMIIYLSHFYFQNFTAIRRKFLKTHKKVQQKFEQFAKLFKYTQDLRETLVILEFIAKNV